MACSLIWAGWYRGFARQSKAKENQALYRFASKDLAASIGENPNLNPKLDLISVDERATGVRTYTLRESEDVIATTRVEPDPGLMETLFATKKVVGGMGGGFKTELDVEQEAILVHSPKVTVRATRENTGTIRWGASWTWAGKGREGSELGRSLNTRPSLGTPACHPAVCIQLIFHAVSYTHTNFLQLWITLRLNSN